MDKADVKLFCDRFVRYVATELSSRVAERVVVEEKSGHWGYDVDQIAASYGLEFIKNETRKRGVTVGLSFEAGKLLVVSKGKQLEQDEAESHVKEKLEVDGGICFLVDEIEGSKNEMPDDRYTVIIAFDYKNRSLRNAIHSSIQRWDGESYFADGEHAATISRKGVEKLVIAKTLDIIGPLTKIYPNTFSAYAMPLLVPIVASISDDLNAWGKESPAYRITGTSTDSILASVLEKAISIDLRKEAGTKRGSYPHDFAPAAFFAISAGGLFLDPQGNDLNPDLLEHKPYSFISCAPGKAVADIVRITRDKILPYIESHKEELSSVF